MSRSKKLLSQFTGLTRIRSFQRWFLGNYLFQGGFTLIELLIVIAIIASLAVVVFVALNPAQRLQDARNAKRTNDIDSIRTAINEYIIDNKSYPTGLSAGMIETQIGTSNGSGTIANPSCVITSGGCNATASACVNLSSSLARYLKSIPTDPLIGSPSATGYSVSIDANSIVTINACGTEGINTLFTIYSNGAVNTSLSDFSYGYSSKNSCDTSIFISPSSCSYAVTFTGWGALNFTVTNGTMSTSGYTNLIWNMYLNGQPVSDFAAFFTDGGGNPISQVTLSSANITGTPASGWVTITVPISQLNPNSVAIGGVYIKNALNQTLNPIHIDSEQFK